VLFYLGLGIFDDRGGMPQSVIKIKRNGLDFFQNRFAFHAGEMRRVG
jgi:hypothetical protein